jgi:hypothetical protein
MRIFLLLLLIIISGCEKQKTERELAMDRYIEIMDILSDEKTKLPTSVLEDMAKEARNLRVRWDIKDSRWKD